MNRPEVPTSSSPATPTPLQVKTNRGLIWICQAPKLNGEACGHPVKKGLSWCGKHMDFRGSYKPSLRNDRKRAEMRLQLGIEYERQRASRSDTRPPVLNSRKDVLSWLVFISEEVLAGRMDSKRANTLTYSMNTALRAMETEERNPTAQTVLIHLKRKGARTIGQDGEVAALPGSS